MAGLWTLKRTGKIFRLTSDPGFAQLISIAFRIMHLPGKRIGLLTNPRQINLFGRSAIPLLLQGTGESQLSEHLHDLAVPETLLA
jgi:uncharacterized protein YbbC (DUF1343 family)